jgi:hypothetical protein
VTCNSDLSPSSCSQRRRPGHWRWADPAERQPSDVVGADRFITKEITPATSAPLVAIATSVIHSVRELPAGRGHGPHQAPTCRPLMESPICELFDEGGSGLTCLVGSFFAT